MMFKELPTEMKRKINGSIASLIRYAKIEDESKDLFFDWLDRKIYCVGDDELFYSLKKHALNFYEEEEIKEEDLFKVDKELLDEIKEIIEARFKKKVLKDQEQKKINFEKMKDEKPTEKQIKYANRLMKKMTGEKNYFTDTDLSKYDIAEKIEQLLKMLEREEKDMGKVIQFPKR